MYYRIHIISILLLSVGFEVYGAPPESGNPELPFATEETTGSLKVVARHRITWNRTSRAINWEQLEVEIPDVARLEVEPGIYNLSSEEDQTLALSLNVRDGSLSSKVTLRTDGTWAAPIETSLGGRDVYWKTPAMDIRNLSLDGLIAIDTALNEDPPRMLQTLYLEPFTIDLLKAGIYEGEAITLRGRWDRPGWTLEHFEARTFGGRFWASGSGRWGTPEPPLVSLELGMEGVDLQALLEAFRVERAGEIEARVRGRAKLEAEGRQWKILELDLVGEEDSVHLSRELLYDLLAPTLTEVLTQKQVDDALNSAFGPERMIPFEELSFEGGLTPRSLNLRLPLQNEVLDLDIEPQIDRELLWDLWDELLEIGAENLRGMGSASASLEKP